MNILEHIFSNLTSPPVRVWSIVAKTAPPVKANVRKTADCPLRFPRQWAILSAKGGDEMGAQEISTALAEIRDGLSALFGARLENVFLYGSYARGEQDNESDVDILAVVNLPAETLERYESPVLDLAVEVGLRYDALFSVLLQDADGFRKYQKAMPFFANVMREGISIV